MVAGSAGMAVLLTMCFGSSPPRCTEAEEFTQIVEWLALRKGSRVADVGAAGGTWTRKIARYVGPSGHVFGTDVKASFLEGVRQLAKSKGYAHVTPILGDQKDTGLPASSCKAILLRLVYHAFDFPRPMRESLFAALQPGGRILIIDFRPSLEQLSEEMIEAGFTPDGFAEVWCGQKDVYARLFVKPVTNKKKKN